MILGKTNYNLINNNPTSPLNDTNFTQSRRQMIIKYTRKSKTKNVIEGYVRVPDTYSYRHAIKLLESYKGLNTKRHVKFERVCDNIEGKRIKEIDINAKQIHPPIKTNPWRTLHYY